MKKLIISALLFCMISIPKAYCDQLHFTSQEQIDTFDLDDWFCFSERVSILIEGENITNLHGLIGIDSCVSIRIRNTSLTNLVGLDSLKSAYWPYNDFIFSDPGVYISNNPMLESVHGLENLQKTSNFTISNNAILKNTIPLNVTEFKRYEDNEVGGRLRGNELVVLNNAMLESIDGMPGLVSGSDFRIENNPLLDDLSGISNFESVCYSASLSFTNGSITIKNNDALTSLSSISSLSACGSITIEDNDALLNLSGLNISTTELRIANNDNLEEFGDLSIFLTEFASNILHSISIIDNPSLMSIALTEFYFLGYDFGYYTVEIEGNSSLAVCNENYVCENLLTNTDYVSIVANAAGCAEIYEVIHDCNISARGGTLYHDDNCNNILDPVDSGIPNAVVRNVSTGEPIALSDASGFYLFYEYNLADTMLSVQPDAFPGYSNSPDNYEVLFSDSILTIDSLDFAFCADSIFTNLSVQNSGLIPPRPGFSNAYQLCVNNHGSVIEEGEVNFSFADNSDLEMYINFEETDGATVDGLKLNWQFSNLGIFESICYTVEISLNSATPLGTIMHSKLSATSSTSTEEIVLEDNCDELEQEVVGSFDPNDKTVTPNLLHADSLVSEQNFEYQIRFQNTGTANAERVVIIDTIPTTLDMASFEMLDASHPYRVVFEGNNVIRWIFEDIQLPPEEIDEIASNGFVKFGIESKAGLNQSQVIKNRAGIYFDFNYPIITEYAVVDYYSDWSDLSVSMDMEFINCDLFIVDVTVKNNTPNEESTQLKFFLEDDSFIDKYQYNDIDQAIQQGDTLIWDISNLASLDSQTYSITVELTENLMNSESFSVSSSINLSDDDPLNNLANIQRGNRIVEGNLDLETQLEVDANYCLEEVKGRLDISKFSGSDINNLSSLNNLVKVGGNLRIRRNHEMLSINGFESLTEVGGDLRIEDNDNLISFSGFENLQRVGLELEFYRNEKLQAIFGFSQLNELEYLKFQNNEQLQAINGFGNLEAFKNLEFVDNPLLEIIIGFSKLESLFLLSVEKSGVTNLDNFSNLKELSSLDLYSNPSLNSIDALSNVGSIKWLNIVSNPVLKRLTGLNNIDSLYQLTLEGNSLLETIEDLENLEFVMFSIGIKDNASLVNLSGLEHVESFGVETFQSTEFSVEGNALLESIAEFNPETHQGIKSLILISNPNLSICNSEFICELLADSTVITKNISGNDTWCSTAEEISLACMTDTDDVGLGQEIKIFPNPVNQLLQFQVEEHRNLHVQIFDVLGSRVINYKAEDSDFSIDMTDLPSGIYNVMIEDKESNMFIVEKIYKIE